MLNGERHYSAKIRRWRPKDQISPKSKRMHSTAAVSGQIIGANPPVLDHESSFAVELGDGRGSSRTQIVIVTISRGRVHVTRVDIVEYQELLADISRAGIRLTESTHQFSLAQSY